MPTFSELVTSFVESHRQIGFEDQDLESNAGYRVAGYELQEKLFDGATRAVAGWQDAGSIDVMLWISREWSGWARKNLEDQLKKLPMVCLTVFPTESFNDLGADVIWWSYPVECMSCGEDLPDNLRWGGLCIACAELRSMWLTADREGDGAGGGIEQRRGIHGDLLPHNRSSGDS